MSNGNPFEGDAERTVIRPSPGGRRQGAQPTQPQAPQSNPFGDMPAPRAFAAPPPQVGGEERTQLAMPRPRGGGASMQAPPPRSNNAPGEIGRASCRERG